MREREEPGLQLIARWTEEDGRERERIIHIGDIARQGSLVIELKAEPEEGELEEFFTEELRLEEHMEWLQGNLPKNTKLWVEKNASDYYSNAMRMYWDYYEYLLKEAEL